jgi:hypothetical protein
MAPSAPGFVESYPNKGVSRATCRCWGRYLAVQVSETTTTGAMSTRKDEVPGEARGADGGRASPSRFSDALKRSVTDEVAAEAAAGLGPCGSGAPPPLRVGPPAARTVNAAASGLTARVDRVDRILVGTVGGDAEARIRIGAGALAGAEIRLCAVAGSAAVTAQLLTPGAGSRQTLSVAMEEIRLRLRDKGIALASSVVRGRPVDDPRRGGEGEREAGSGWSTGR